MPQNQPILGARTSAIILYLVHNNPPSQSNKANLFQSILLWLLPIVNWLQTTAMLLGHLQQFTLFQMQNWSDQRESQSVHFRFKLCWIVEWVHARKEEILTMLYLLSINMVFLSKDVNIINRWPRPRKVALLSIIARTAKEIQFTRTTARM